MPTRVDAAPEATTLPDQPARDAIIRERARNVAVIAGAGTGKTHTIIRRAVELLAPRAPGAPALSIKRLAALTFTRRAAGELRFRIREQLLRELEYATRAHDPRLERLRDALSNLDAAFIGTIHGFADRLLRLRPVEAKLSPAYALVEDVSELVRETFVRLRRGAEAGTLPAALGPYAAGLDPALIAEAADTLRAATRAGLQMERADSAYGQLPSVEAVLASMIDTRDVAVTPPDIPDCGMAAARAAADALTQRLRVLRRTALGHRRLRRLSEALHRLHEMDDPHDAAEAVRIIQEAWRGRAIYMRDFDGDATGWGIYKTVRPDPPGPLADQLRGPHRWLAVRLVRLFPVLKAMYERVKEEHEVVDYLDLLGKLRNVLRDAPDARRFYQGLFDHIFVDEFQDTDPLQCEIVFFLCEDGAEADRWDQVELTPGKLTIVGDPKQSIYRFRRADIIMYERATERLRASGALERRLDTNLRSRPELIGFFNDRLGALLGRDQASAVDAVTGRAGYEDLTPDPRMPPSGACVHVLPYAGPDGAALLAEGGRAIEAQMLARYVRWLLHEGPAVRDPNTGEERSLRPGDIAVLARVTTNLRLLLAEFDGLGLEYSARGGTLFLSHPVARQFLLGLRAIADRDDGVAAAALLRPPFFALDCADVVAGAVASDAGATELAVSRARYGEALAIISELRRCRFERSPGATARDLIECTALGAAVATGRNGTQTLAALYEIAWELDRRAALDRLDYDRATALVRAWAEAPMFLGAPEPLGDDAVRVMTIHQAKGLEFPVVILWDGFQILSERGGGLWSVDRDGTSWALNLGAVAVEQPAGSQLIEREKRFGEFERQRMYYVAATRARDLLVLPLPLTKSESQPYVTKKLAEGAPPALVRRFKTFHPGLPPPLARPGDRPATPTVVYADTELQAQLDARTAAFARQLAATPLAIPTAMTAEAKLGADGDEEEDSAQAERQRKAADARHGAQFGIVVHRSLELLLSGAQQTTTDAVRIAATEVLALRGPPMGLLFPWETDGTGAAAGGSNPSLGRLRGAEAAALSVGQLAEAAADVERALGALRAAAIAAEHGWQLCCEYPIYDVQPGKLLNGFIDLLAVSDSEVAVIDFKSDQPRAGDVANAYPAYAQQLRFYGQALERSGRLRGRRLRLGLLLTATGELRWS